MGEKAARYPLREEQRRSLAWMYAQEDRDHRLKGGLLADKMGYGKTATTIGLLSEKVPGSIPEQRPRGYISNPATLILCPPHLVEQWEDEFCKFLGDQVELVLPPLKVSNSRLFTIHGLAVSELSQEMQRRNAKLAPDKRLKVGDVIKQLKIVTSLGLLVTLCEKDVLRAHSYQSFLDAECEEGCTLHITVVRERSPHMKPFKGDGPFRILTVAKNTDFARLNLGDLLEPFNVILVSTSILGTEQHMKGLKRALNDWLAEDGEDISCGKQMGFRLVKLRDCVEKWHQKDSFLKAALSATPAFLEAMWWNRKQVCGQINCRDPGHIPVAMGAGFEVLAQSLDAAHQSLDFYEGQRSCLSDTEKLTSQTCSVCLCPNDNLADLVMLPCAHFFHRDCVREALATNPKCPYCRADAPPKSLSSVLLEASQFRTVQLPNNHIVCADVFCRGTNFPQQLLNSSWIV
eukprot:Skav211060  [mRNA]  locus=scaffold314:82334:89235:+ [translate_table: standard]